MLHADDWFVHLLRPGSCPARLAIRSARMGPETTCILLCPTNRCRPVGWESLVGQASSHVSPLPCSHQYAHLWSAGHGSGTRPPAPVELLSSERATCAEPVWSGAMTILRRRHAEKDSAWESKGVKAPLCLVAYGDRHCKAYMTVVANHPHQALMMGFNPSLVVLTLELETNRWHHAKHYIPGAPQ